MSDQTLWKVTMLPGVNRLPWMEANFSERQIKEIEFCLIYASDVDHETDRNKATIVLARLASLLNSLHFRLVGRNYPEDIDPIMGFDLKTEDDSD